MHWQRPFIRRPWGFLMYFPWDGLQKQDWQAQVGCCEFVEMNWRMPKIKKEEFFGEFIESLARC